MSLIIVQAYWCCNGVVLLHELPEFIRRNVPEVMLQLLEDGNITVSRALHQLPRRCHAGRGHEPLKVQNGEQHEEILHCDHRKCLVVC